MTRRPLSPYFASLLLVLQLLTAPFMHAAASTPGDMNCAGMTHGSAMGMDAGDCGHAMSGTNGGCPPDGQQCHGQAACSCQCAQTQALETDRFIIFEPTPPVAAESVLATPAFDTPVFKLLRPPK
jgi:hypothetical protein